MSSRLMDHPQALCNMARRVIVEAGDSTLGLFDANGGIVSDASHASAAEARRMVLQAAGKKLADILPGVPVVIAGESDALPDMENAWVLDPLEGMDAFAKGEDTYCITAAFIKKGQPALGIIYLPATGEMYAAAGPGSAMRWQAETGREKSLRMRSLPSKGLCVAADPEQIGTQTLEKILADQMVARVLPVQGSLKFCMMAAGKADFCLCAGSDALSLAAGDAILRGANGAVVHSDGAPVAYRERGMPGGLMAASQPWLEAWLALAAPHSPGRSDSIA